MSSSYLDSTACLVVSRPTPPVARKGGRGRDVAPGHGESPLTLARTSIKKAVAKSGARRRDILGWGELLRGLPTAEARSAALGRFRAGGFGPDNFGRSRSAREAMADALARTEHDLELRRACIDLIRQVRRRLEGHLWP